MYSYSIQCAYTYYILLHFLLKMYCVSNEKDAERILYWVLLLTAANVSICKYSFGDHLFKLGWIRRTFTEAHTLANQELKSRFLPRS